MKKAVVTFLFNSLLCFGFSQSNDIDSLYFGQTPPGNTAVIFAQGIISKIASYEHDITFSPDGKEMFYCISQANWSDFKIYHSYWSVDHWSEPVLADFSKQFKNAEASFSPDGQSLLFASNRAPASEPWNYAVFKITKSAGQWSTPVEIGIKALQPTGIDGNWHPSITSDSMVYFSSYVSGNYDIFSSKLKDGIAENFIKLGITINTSYNDLYSWIAPDNSYLLFSSDRPGGSGLSDLYISYHKKDNAWTSPKNLGSVVNTSDEETSPRITSDGKFLFFTRTNNWDGDFYWVRANFIDSLKFTNFEPYVNNKINNQTDTLGHSFSFTVPDSIFIDDDGNNTLSFSAMLSDGKPLPKWLTFNPVAKTFSGKLDSIGAFNIKVIASDTAKAEVSTTFYLKVVDNHISLIKQNIEQNIQVYPNPTKDMINIAFGLLQYKTAIVEITEISGKLISMETFHNISTATIDLTGNAKGVYLINLDMDGQKLNKKIIIE